MSEDVLFVQGAGEGAYLEDQALADYLESGLGHGYRVHYPRFEGLETVDFPTWKDEIRRVLSGLNDPIVVTHSLGGAALLKFMAEEGFPASVSALFMIATPYKGSDGEWGEDDFAVDAGFATALPRTKPLFLYHSDEDEWVPFEHMARWAEKLEHATIRAFSNRGHSFSSQPFRELIEDIKASTR